MVGSSWNSADANGDAPMRSPAATNTEFFTSDLAALTAVARYAAPPASTVVFPSLSVIRPDEPAGGCRLPWKSLTDITRMANGGGVWGFGLSPLPAAAVPLTVMVMATAMVPTTAPMRRLVCESFTNETSTDARAAGTPAG